MPVRALDKREVTEAERWAICKTANLCIVLKPDFKCFKVPLHELRQEMWGKVSAIQYNDSSCARWRWSEKKLMHCTADHIQLNLRGPAYSLPHWLPLGHLRLPCPLS